MLRINWYETVLKGIFTQQILANYALMLNGATKIQPRNVRTTRMFIANNSLTTVYLGADGNVNDSNGFPILPNDVIVICFYAGISLYLYGENQEVRVLEVC
jgi:hypothetical protein